jgi:iron complex outermembrane receptor protein
VRAVGNHGGHEFDRSCEGAAFGNFCMRSPYIGNNTSGATASAAYAGLVQTQAARVQSGVQLALSLNPATSANASALAAAIVAGLRNATPGEDQLATRVAYLLSPSVSITPEQVRDIGPLKSNYNNTFEVGYKGQVGRKGTLSLDVWAQERADVSPPAGVATPSVFFEPGDVASFLGANITSSLVPLFMAQGMPQQQATATAQAIAQNLVPTLTGIVAAAPLGTITFADQTRPDVLFSYFNLNRRIKVYGLDLGYSWDLTSTFAVAGSYSWQSENVFDEVVFSVADGGNGIPYMSNSPKHKATLSLQYQPGDGNVSAEIRGRYADAFPVNSSLFTSGYSFDDPNSADTTVTYRYAPVPTSITLDAGITWRPSFGGRDIALSLNGTNILDNRRATFAGTPKIGRVIMTRLRYAF